MGRKKRDATYFSNFWDFVEYVRLILFFHEFHSHRPYQTYFSKYLHVKFHELPKEFANLVYHKYMIL